MPPLNRNNSAPTPSPSSPLVDVLDLKEIESLRDRMIREEKEKQPPWPSIIPSSVASPSSDGRRSTASLPLPGEHAGEPLHRLGGVLSPSTMVSSSVLHPCSSLSTSTYSAT